MTFVARERAKDVKAIRAGDRQFMIDDGMVTYPRAMLHVTPECPVQIRNQINWAMAEGYVKCVAHVYGKELTLDELR